MSLRSFVNLRALALAALLLSCNWLAPMAHAQNNKDVAVTAPKATVQEASLIQLPALELQPTLSGAAPFKLATLHSTLAETGPTPEAFCVQWEYMYVCSGAGDREVCRWAWVCTAYSEDPV